MSDKEYMRSARAKFHRIFLIVTAPFLMFWAYMIDNQGARIVIGVGAIIWLVLGIIDSPGRIERKQFYNDQKQK